jgi:hypothetical protein
MGVCNGSTVNRLTFQYTYKNHYLQVKLKDTSSPHFILPLSHNSLFLALSGYSLLLKRTI